jgi:tetratricopeptide (TPR) repeat protein
MIEGSGREGRRHHIPPAPSPLDAHKVLEHLESALGLVFWKALRDVHAWADGEPGRRRELFQPPNQEVRERLAYATLEAPELDSALRVFALIPEAPDLISPRDLAQACHEVVVWADSRGMMTTCLSFAEAAAFADPMDPERANFAARMSRRSIHNERAAAWYFRAFKLAVQSNNLSESIFALLGYGAMMRDAGRYNEARKAFERAGRRASRRRRNREAAEAHHDLLIIAVELRKYKLANNHATKALTYYPSDHPSIPALAHDIGFLFIRKRFFGLALVVLENAAHLLSRTEEQAIAWSSVAWAAAAVGQADRSREAEHRTLQLVALHQDFAAAAFLHLAESCRALGDWERAVLHADAALDFATRRSMPELQREAKTLRTEVVAREKPPETLPPSDQANALLRLTLDRLKKWAAPGQS